MAKTRKCDICGIITSFEREDESEPNEGQVCDICDKWVCDICVAWSESGTDRHDIVCVNCEQQSNSEECDAKILTDYNFNNEI